MRNMNNKLKYTTLALLIAGNELRHFYILRRLKMQCVTDPLTGLKNRGCLEKSLSRYRRCRNIGVIFWDIDGLKELNDTLGHAEGDRALKELARSLSDAFGCVGELYRYGGDEFVLITESISEQRIAELCEKWEKLSKVRAAWGYAFGDGKELELVIHNADVKMYEKKQRP